MDASLKQAACEMRADEIFELARKNYHTANKGYIQKQIRIASEYLTDEQKKELVSKGYSVP